MTDRHTAVSEHRIVHRTAPLQWRDGFPLGNGEIGVMFWGDGDPLAFTLDKADLWDLRINEDFRAHPDYNYAGLQRLVAEQRADEVLEVFEERQRRDNPIGPTKISIGRAELQIPESEHCEYRLEIGTATVEGCVRTRSGERQLQGFVHRDRNVFCLRVAGCGPDAAMSLVPLADMNESLAELGHPEPQLEEAGELRTLVQTIPSGPAYCVAWNPSGPDFFLAMESAATSEEARSKALRSWQSASADGFENLLEEHTRSWSEFWSGSAVFLPEQRIEFLWYYGLYLLASSARRGSIPPGLQGLWPMDGVLPPWRGDYHADMNVQETFRPACASGHLDLLDSWCDLMKDCIDPVQDFTRQFFGTEGTFWTCSFFPGYTLAPGWGTVQYAWSHSGWLGWLVWMRWRYSMDLEWLAETGYPVLAEILKFYRANLREEEDGCLHIPVSNSPEYRNNTLGAWCKEPNSDIGLIRRCCDWVTEAEAALGKDELGASAKEMKDKLVPYHLTERNELCLWGGQPLDESHRHPSHLMPIYPAMDLTVEDGEESRAIIDASLDHFLSLGQYLWAGHTYPQIASLAAMVGRPELAYDCVHQVAEYWIGPNGLHFNRDARRAGRSAFRGENGPFTIEAICAIGAGMSDILLQGWRDVVRVFPAVPEHWRDVAFRDLLTEGGFRVSAIRRESRTVWVKVTATVARTLSLRNPFGDAAFEIDGGSLCREGDILVTEMSKGQEITLCVEGYSESLPEAVERTRASDTSRLGLR